MLHRIYPKRESESVWDPDYTLEVPRVRLKVRWKTETVQPNNSSPTTPRYVVQVQVPCPTRLPPISDDRRLERTFFFLDTKYECHDFHPIIYFISTHTYGSLQSYCRCNRCIQLYSTKSFPNKLVPIGPCISFIDVKSLFTCPDSFH